MVSTGSFIKLVVVKSGTWKTSALENGIGNTPHPPQPSLSFPDPLKILFAASTISRDTCK